MMSDFNRGSASIDLNLLSDYYRDKFLSFVGMCAGSKKAIVWDGNLADTFSFFSQYSVLKANEVEKMFELAERGSLPKSSDISSALFVLCDKISSIDKLASYIRMAGTIDCHVLFVPRYSSNCRAKLEELEIIDNIKSVDEFPLDFLPLDSDLLSLEMSDSFLNCHVYDDYTSLYHAARGIMQLQNIYGVIANIYSLGKCGQRVADILLRMRREVQGEEPPISPHIDTLLLVDRIVDPLTPMMSQLTYEGLIDEQYHIERCKVELPGEKFGNTMQAKKIQLNSSEQLYCELRDRNFATVGQALSRKAKEISALVEEKDKARSISEMRQFVTKLPLVQADKQSLAIHTSIAELLKEFTDTEQFYEYLRAQQALINEAEEDECTAYLEGLISKRHNLTEVLRLLCIYCFCQNGFKQKYFDSIRREIVQAYGFEQVLTLLNLEKTGLIYPQERRIYPYVRKTMQLTVDHVSGSENQPTDMAYLYSGYAPLSARLAQFLSRPGGWRSINEMLNIIANPVVEHVQKLPTALANSKTDYYSPNSGSRDAEPSVTLVVFLGGVTYAEVAAFRFLSQLDEYGTTYLVATTNITNGNDLVNPLIFDKPKETVDSGNPFL